MMKNFYQILLACSLILGISLSTKAQNDLIITAAFDGPLSGGTPKGIEIYVVNTVADLSVYGVGSANNGGGTDGVEFILSGSANAGDFLYLATEAVEFENYFGFAPTFTDGAAAGINGDDAVELFYDVSGTFTGSEVVVDVFGDINTDGSGEPWDHLDGWAYRNDGTGPEGSTFTVANWTFSGINALDGCTSNSTCSSEIPIGTYSPTASTADELSISATDANKAEGNSGTTEFTFTVTRSGSSTGTTNVDWAVSSSEADTDDFDGTTLPSGTVNFTGSETSKTITVNVTGDTDSESDEAFTVTLSNATSSWTIITATANGTIQNDDATSATIAEARAATDGDLLSITGIVTTPNFGFGNAEFYVQDATGGIKVRVSESGTGAGDLVINMGDEVTIVGNKGEFASEIRIEPAMGSNITVNSTGNTLPAASAINGVDVTVSNALQGSRVQLTGVTVKAGETWPTEAISSGSGVNVVLVAEDASEFILRIDRGESFFDGSAQPTEAFTLTGVLGRFNDDAQVFPFVESDISIPSTEPTALPQQLRWGKLDLYPNPSADNFRLVIEGEAQPNTVNFVVYNQFGQPVMSDKVSSSDGTFELNMSKLPTGAYTLKMQIGEQVIARKIVKR